MYSPPVTSIYPVLRFFCVEEHRKLCFNMLIEPSAGSKVSHIKRHCNTSSKEKMMVMKKNCMVKRSTPTTQGRDFLSSYYCFFFTKKPTKSDFNGCC